MKSGWLNKSDFTPLKIVNIFEKCQIKGFVYTDVNRDGMLNGLDLDKIYNFAASFSACFELLRNIASSKSIIKTLDVLSLIHI